MTKRSKRALLVVYMLAIVFFMFFGFNRAEKFDSFQFSFTFYSIPLWFPRSFSPFRISLWLFALGNVIAFVPLGFLIPANLPSSRWMFIKSLALFTVGITVLELLQMLSLRGIFDIEDVFANTVGFVIGYASMKIAKKQTKPWKGAIVFFSVSAVLVLLSVAAAEMINRRFF